MVFQNFFQNFHGYSIATRLTLCGRRAPGHRRDLDAPKVLSSSVSGMTTAAWLIGDHLMNGNDAVPCALAQNVPAHWTEIQARRRVCKW